MGCSVTFLFVGSCACTLRACSSDPARAPFGLDGDRDEQGDSGIRSGARRHLNSRDAADADYRCGRRDHRTEHLPARWRLGRHTRHRHGRTAPRVTRLHFQQGVRSDSPRTHATGNLVWVVAKNVMIRIGPIPLVLRSMCWSRKAKNAFLIEGPPVTEQHWLLIDVSESRCHS